MPHVPDHQTRAGAVAEKPAAAKVTEEKTAENVSVKAAEAVKEQSATAEKISKAVKKTGRAKKAEAKK